MNTTDKRQTIILIVAALALLYGLFDLTIGSGTKRGEPDAKMREQELQSFISETTANMARDIPSPYDTYVVSRAGSVWAHNPFSQRVQNESRIVPKNNSYQRSFFVYQGYIETGGRSVALINNFEYATGEPLEKEGFFLKKISPSKVIIEDRKEKTNFEIPLSE